MAKYDDFELQVFDELPPAAPRQSKMVDILDKVKELPHGKPILVREYDSAQKATGGANHLKLRWGSQPDAYGFRFLTRKISDTSHGLFVIYDPSKIVDGAAADVDKKYEEFRAKAAARQKAKPKLNKAEKQARLKDLKVPPPA